MPESTQRQHRQGSIEWLSEELRDAVFYVDDPELKQQMINWLKRASQVPEGDMMDLVETRLTRIRQVTGEEDDHDEYPMRRLEEDGEGDFPDSCKGCDHYGSRCPIFVDPVERRRRKQIQKGADGKTPSEIRQDYRRYAEANGCHQIPAAITEWEDDHQQLVKEGWELYESFDADIGYTDEVDEAAREIAEAERGDL